MLLPHRFGHAGRVLLLGRVGKIVRQRLNGRAPEGSDHRRSERGASANGDRNDALLVTTNWNRTPDSGQTGYRLTMVRLEDNRPVDN